MAFSILLRRLGVQPDPLRMGLARRLALSEIQHRRMAAFALENAVNV